MMENFKHVAILLFMIIGLALFLLGLLAFFDFVREYTTYLTENNWEVFNEK